MAAGSQRSSMKDPNENEQRPLAIADFASQTTFHGCANIFTQTRCSAKKMIWGWMFVGALAYNKIKKRIFLRSFIRKI